MSKISRITRARWFENCGGWFPRRRLDELRAGIAQGWLDEQDEGGMTALSLAVVSEWAEGVQELLRAGANTELRHHMTGQTALHIAVVDVGNEELIKALIEAGANPDAGNYGGFTPRQAAKMLGFSKVFRGVPRQKATIAAVRIQNAEQLADQYYPTFKIPERKERETLEPGQAVKLYVFGRKEQDTVKVRISKRRGRGSKVRYVATVETPLKQTSLPAGTKEVEFGPENVASIYHPAAKKAVKGRRGS